MNLPQLHLGCFFVCFFTALRWLSALLRPGQKQPWRFAPGCRIDANLTTVTTEPSVMSQGANLTASKFSDHTPVVKGAGSAPLRPTHFFLFANRAGKSAGDCKQRANHAAFMLSWLTDNPAAVQTTAAEMFCFSSYLGLHVSFPQLLLLLLPERQTNRRDHSGRENKNRCGALPARGASAL